MQGASTELNFFAQGIHTLGPNQVVGHARCDTCGCVPAFWQQHHRIRWQRDSLLRRRARQRDLRGNADIRPIGLRGRCLTLRGTQPGSAGVLNMIGHVGGLTGGGTIDNGDVTLCAGGGLGAGTTLTLGPSLSVNATSGSNTLSAPLLINDGTITATTAGSSISFLGGHSTMLARSSSAAA